MSPRHARKAPALVLTRQWTRTEDIRRATKWTPKRTTRVLRRLEERGLIESAMVADGSTALWRLARDRRAL